MIELYETRPIYLYQNVCVCVTDNLHSIYAMAYRSENVKITTLTEDIAIMRIHLTKIAVHEMSFMYLTFK